MRLLQGSKTVACAARSPSTAPCRQRAHARHCRPKQLFGWTRAIAVQAEGGDLEDLHVSTFHGLCRLAAVQLGREFTVPEDPEPAQVFWRSRAPEFLLDAITEEKVAFDAVVVDEAQDLETEWWVTVEALAPATGSLWVFYDPGQDIYGRSAAMPEGLVPLALTMNCRSTRTLRQLCDRLSGRETTSPDLAPEGQPHEEIHYTSVGSPCQKLEVRVAALCSEGLDPCQLVILSPHRQQNSSLAGMSALAGHPIVARQEERGILFATARRFKGLEADVVLLIDQDRAQARKRQDRPWRRGGQARCRDQAWCCSW